VLQLCCSLHLFTILSHNLPTNTTPVPGHTDRHHTTLLCFLMGPPDWWNTRWRGEGVRDAKGHHPPSDNWLTYGHPGKCDMHCNRQALHALPVFHITIAVYSNALWWYHGESALTTNQSTIQFHFVYQSTVYAFLHFLLLMVMVRLLLDSILYQNKSCHIACLETVQNCKHISFLLWHGVSEILTYDLTLCIQKYVDTPSNEWIQLFQPHLI
jgi:hypothetical protein